MLRFAFATLFLLLAACGQVPNDKIIVEQYVYENGSLPPSTNLGFTYQWDDGVHCLLNKEMLDSPDDDLLVRVLIHELAAAIIIDTGDVPPYGPGWYAFDSDTLPPFTEIGPDEAAWFAAHGPYRVNVADDWLRQPVAEALLRVALASGVEVFK